MYFMCKHGICYVRSVKVLSSILLSIFMISLCNYAFLRNVSSIFMNYLLTSYNIFSTGVMVPSKSNQYGFNFLGCIVTY